MRHARRTIAQRCDHAAIHPSMQRPPADAQRQADDPRGHAADLELVGEDGGGSAGFTLAGGLLPHLLIKCSLCSDRQSHGWPSRRGLLVNDRTVAAPAWRRQGAWQGLSEGDGKPHMASAHSPVMVLTCI
jgi:hypothetical protein